MRKPYLLMRKDVGTKLTFLTLNELNISLHAIFGKVLSEKVTNVGVGMKTAELYSERGVSGSHPSLGAAR